MQVLLMDTVNINSLPGQQFRQFLRQAAMQRSVGDAFTPFPGSTDLYRSLQVVHLGACRPINDPKLGRSQLFFHYPMGNRTMLIEGVPLQDYDEFHALLLLGRKAVVDVEEGIVLLMPTRALPDVENQIACLQLQDFLPAAVVTQVDQRIGREECLTEGTLFDYRPPLAAIFAVYYHLVCDLLAILQYCVLLADIDPLNPLSYCLCAFGLGSNANNGVSQGEQ